MPLLDVPDTRQRGDYDCGAACVDAVAAFFGKRKRGPAALANPIQGMSPDTVEAVLRSLGFGILSGAMTVADLGHLTATGRPVLCPVADHGGHWLVVRGVARDKVHVMDPDAGFRRVPRDGWLAGWRDVSRSGHRYDRWGIGVGVGG